MTRTNQIFPWALIFLFSAAAGAFFNLFVMANGRPMIGASFGIFIGIPMFAFMRGLLLGRLQQRVRRLPFPLYAPVSLVLYIL
jgi:adenylate cyclase